MTYDTMPKQPDGVNSNVAGQVERTTEEERRLRLVQGVRDLETCGRKITVKVRRRRAVREERLERPGQV